MVVLYEFFEDRLVEFVFKCVYDVYCVDIFSLIEEEMVKVVLVSGEVEFDCFLLVVLLIVL